MQEKIDIDENIIEKEIIETDEDTKEEDKIEGDSLYPHKFDPNAIEIVNQPFSIFEYLRQLKNNKIITQPDFQRHQVWKPEQKSRFIESIILNYPLPPIYLNENKESKYMVIDGLQRTTTLDEFYHNKFALKGLEALPQYNGKKFEDIDDKIQSTFENKTITVFILKPSTPIQVVYDLFNRINTGGTQLNRQEVRNCIYIGESTKLLKELSEEQYFKTAISGGVSPKRMKDREVILRYLAFRWKGVKEYSGDMSKFLEDTMKWINNMDDKEIIQIQEIKKDFQYVMEQSYYIFGERNFRIPTQASRGRINIAILETVCYYLSSLTSDFIKRNKEIIERNYFEKLLKDDDYFDAATRSTGDKARVLKRFELIKKILNEGTQ